MKLSSLLLFLPVPACWSLSSPTTTTTNGASRTLSSVTSATITPTPTSIPLSLNQKALDEGSRFPRTWVPIASVLELNPDRPTPVDFLNQKYVVYKGNGEDKWVMVDDACPHRLAPLAEGRIETTESGERRLQCSYHGWSFDSSGTCQSIPQVTDTVQARAVEDPRCSVKSYPTIVENSILWVWPWKEDVIEETMKKPWIEPEHMMDGLSSIVSTYTRDLPYGWDTLIENLIDPAHVPFAHHGLQGKREDAIPINMTAPSHISEMGFQLGFEDRTMELMRTGAADFRAPYIIKYDGVFETDNPLRKFFNLTAICIPTKPGWSRAMILGTLGPPKPETDEDGNVIPQKRSFAQIVFSNIPIWLFHILSNRFLDSDLAFLHYQEQERERRGGDVYGVENSSDENHKQGDIYFMPAQADRAINAFRRWKNQHASVLLPLPPAIHNRDILFDRYTQHTAHCKHCSKGLESIEKTRLLTTGMLALSVLVAATQLPVIGSLAAATCLGVFQVLRFLENELKTGEFKHYENN